VADQPPKATKKRRVKNPETFRERAVKAATENEAPKRSLKQAGGKVATPIARPVSRAASKLWNFKPLKLLHKPLRLIGRIVFPVYFRQSFRELRLVKWPDWLESRRLTIAVLIFAIIFGALIAGVDYGLDKAFRSILLK
jgi:preprotein translocase SecE subunit